MRSRLLKLRTKIVLRLTLVYLLISVLSLVIFRWLLPDQYFSLYPLIGIFFWMLGMGLNFALDRARFSNPDSMINVFLTFRVFKLVLSIAFVWLSGLIEKGHQDVFVISIVVNYVIFTFMEIYILHMYNKRIQKRHAHVKANK